jgi:Holliday junction resolvase RusA-like endonuclease
MLTFTLPIAPSVNAAFLNRKGGHGYGRIKSAKYRAWIKNADAHYLMQKKDIVPARGPYICGMIFPLKLKGDLDNRAKCILDWMVSRGLTSDDKYLQGLHLVRDETPYECVVIQVKEIAGAGSQLSGAEAFFERPQG